MRIPRRVPWSAISELEQVCNWIYNDEYDLEAKILAVNRLSAWRAITSLPHALESALSLLVVNIEDQKITSKPSGSAFTLILRQTYATALVRLVNGLVDPLQQGVYARSIASIAQQIGLPQWLVELRHAATHEELPSLELLRSGAGEGLVWLLHNYFLPTLASPSGVDDAIKTCKVAPVQPILKRYKTLMKTLARDVSLVHRHKRDVAELMQEVESWISNARVAASAAIFRGWGTETSTSRGDHEDWRGRWAVERLCDALLERGGLVPVSSKKRTASSRDTSLPEVLKNIWKHLLLSVHSNHPSFPSILLSRILDLLLQRADTSRSEQNGPLDRSWDFCLAGWAQYIAEEWEEDEDSNSAAHEVNVNENLDNPVSYSIHRRDVVVSLVTALGSSNNSSECIGANLLLDRLTSGDSELENIRSLLQPITTAWRSQRPISGGDGEKLIDLMDERLINVLSITNLSQEDTPLPAASEITSDEKVTLPRGWGKVPANTWKPCPIGTYNVR